MSTNNILLFCAMLSSGLFEQRRPSMLNSMLIRALVHPMLLNAILLAILADENGKNRKRESVYKHRGLRVI